MIQSDSPLYCSFGIGSPLIIAGSLVIQMLEHLANLDLIHLFDFYLAAMLVVGTVRRYSLYRTTAGIAFRFPGRWPKLLKLMHSHHAVLLTWKTFLPSIMTLVVWLAHMLASRLLWNHAHLTSYDVFQHWTALLTILLFGLAMIALDTYFLIVVGVIDRPMIEGYFDQAEHWLSSWKAPVVRAVTFGFIHPRRMVNDEVQKALVAAGDLLERSLYLTALQMGLRVAFGLSLWLTWALAGPNGSAGNEPLGTTLLAVLLFCG